MALKKSSSLNLDALRQDYSMLPRIAAVKAQADQQIFGAIQSGLQKRKEKSEKRQLENAAKKMIQPLLTRPEFERRFGTNVSADDVLKLIGDPRQAINLAENVIRSEREFEDRQRQIVFDRQRLAQNIRTRELQNAELEGNKVFSDVLLKTFQNEKYSIAPEEARKLTRSQLVEYLKVKKEITPDDIKVLSGLGGVDFEGGLRVLTKNGKFAGFFTLPDSAQKGTAAEADIKNRIRILNEVKEHFKKGENSEAIIKINAIGIRPNGDPASVQDLPTAMAVVGLVEEELKNLLNGEVPDETPPSDEGQGGTPKSGVTPRGTNFREVE